MIRALLIAALALPCMAGRVETDREVSTDRSPIESRVYMDYGISCEVYWQLYVGLENGSIQESVEVNRADIESIVENSCAMPLFDPRRTK